MSKQAFDQVVAAAARLNVQQTTIEDHIIGIKLLDPDTRGLLGLEFGDSAAFTHNLALAGISQKSIILAARATAAAQAAQTANQIQAGQMFSNTEVHTATPGMPA